MLFIVVSVVSGCRPGAICVVARMFRVFIALVVGFAVGYALRECLSRRRRAAERKRFYERLEQKKPSVADSIQVSRIIGPEDGDDQISPKGAGRQNKRPAF